MRRSLLFIGILAFLFTLLFVFGFNYEAIIAFYHLFVLGIILVPFVFINILIGGLYGNKKTGRVILNILNVSFLSALVTVYALIAGSNFFWKKTITLPIIKNYLQSLNQFIDIVPIEKWILVSAVVLFILFLLFIAYWFRPKPLILYNRYKLIQTRRLHFRIYFFSSIFIFLLVLFFKPLKRAKRAVHFAEEPFLQFALGGIWGLQNDIAFDTKRFNNGLRDKPCIDSIQKYDGSNKVIVVILMDALRSDHLPAYGYVRKTSPFIDSLRQSRNLQIVRSAFSTSTMTIGGISGLFFSRDWNKFGFNGLSLMKFMKRSGFTTYAFLTGFHRDWYGLSALYRGNCDYYYESLKNSDGDGDNDLVTLLKIKKTKLEPNAFIYIHLLSTHSLGKKADRFRKFLPDKIGYGTSRKTALINNYDNGILQADFVIREIFSKLKSQNLLANATIFMVADHGELFGESNAWGHGGNINEHLLSVPIMVYDNDPNWYRNTDVATLKDIAPTIAERISRPIPSCWEGFSLHRPAQDFSMNVESVEKCNLPYGILSRQNLECRLAILNARKEVHRVTILRTNGSWQTIK